MVQLNFNAQQFTPQYAAGGGLPAPADGSAVRYKVIISDAEQKPTQKNDGGYLAFALKCIEGPCAGTIQYDNLNLWNKSQQAVEIANKQLSAYCHVTGKFNVGDASELFNIPLQIDVRRQRNNPDFTEVCGVYDINGREPGGSVAGPVQAAPPPQGAPPAGVGPQGGQWQQPPQGGPAAGPQGGWQPNGQPDPSQGGQPPAGQWQPPQGSNGGGVSGNAAGGGWQPNQGPGAAGAPSWQR